MVYFRLYTHFSNRQFDAIKLVAKSLRKWSEMRMKMSSSGDWPTPSHTLLQAQSTHD